jgi:transglutaminase-like putative cysteine protease
LVRVTADGVPRFGVVRTGEVLKTATPVPVSSVKEFKSAADSAVVVACEAEPRKRAREAVREEKVVVRPERAALVMVGVVRVLLVRVWVPPTVTTDVLLVPAVVTRRSPVPTVKTPEVWVATQSPLAILKTKPVLPKRFCQPRVAVPRELPPAAAGLRAVLVSCISAALLIPQPSVLAAGR